MNSLSEIADIIKANHSFGVTYHVSPDGDACGSVMALVQGLRKLGKEAYIISRDLTPDNLGFLPLSMEIAGHNTKPKNNSDILIALDCGNEERLSCDISDFTGMIINVDHHITNDMYGRFNYVDSSSSATSEIIYSLLNELDIELDTSIAKCLYTGILTDTGSFRHSNTTSSTHKVVSNLLNYNINHTKIHSALFDNKPFSKLKLIGRVLDDCKLLFNGKLILLYVTKQMLNELNIDNIDTGDLVSYGLQVENTEVSVLLKETDCGVKVSLRSKNEFDVRNIAEKFGGGGHIKASGITFNDCTLSEVKDKILNEFAKELD